MARIMLRNPAGDRVENPDLGMFRSNFFSDGYWNQGSGDAVLEFNDGESNWKLLIMPNAQYEIYLKYLDGSFTWLSLENRNRLNEEIDCLDDWLASPGLFLPRVKAWLAVEDFVRTATRSEQIAWITPDEIPDGGNW